jgi:hypothetical protein
LIASLCACARAPRSGDSAPGPVAGDHGVLLRYAEGAELTQTTSFSVEHGGGGESGRVGLDLRARLSWSPRGDQREVAWQVVAVDDVDLHGTLALRPEDDPRSDLVTHAKGAYLIDLAGERDEVSSPTLRANAGFHAAVQTLRAGDASAPTRARLLSLVPVAMALPELPKSELVVGQRVTIEDAQEVELEGEGAVMPATVTRIYTLVKIDDQGASPIAELSIELVSSGLLELPDASLSIEGAARGTVLFDVARSLPVAYELSRTETFDFAGRVGESTTILETTWDD